MNGNLFKPLEVIRCLKSKTKRLSPFKVEYKSCKAIAIELEHISNVAKSYGLKESGRIQLWFIKHRGHL